jgi:integrase
VNRARDILLRDNGNTLQTKRSFNSLLKNSKAIFHEDKTCFYPNWNPIWVESFLKIKGFRNTAKRYVLPPSELIQNTFSKLAAIDGPVWVCMTLALRAGLRRNEIAYARQSWLQPQGMMTKLHIYPEDDFTPKGSNGFTEMPTSVVKDILNVSKDCTYLLGIGSEWYRNEKIPKLAVQMLREWGWTEYRCPLHELRKLFGAVISTTQGLYQAQKYLRHSNPQITNDDYADLVETEEIVELWAG